VKLTEPQKRALMWLPKDGGWVGNVGRGMSGACGSLALYHSDLCEHSYRPMEMSDVVAHAYRLTHAGLELRRNLENGQ
jgi:hypothetical protein